MKVDAASEQGSSLYET